MMNSSSFLTNSFLGWNTNVCVIVSNSTSISSRSTGSRRIQNCLYDNNTRITNATISTSFNQLNKYRQLQRTFQRSCQQQQKQYSSASAIKTTFTSSISTVNSIQRRNRTIMQQHCNGLVRRRYESTTTTTTTTTKASNEAGAGNIEAPEKLINELAFIVERKGGIDSWVNHLNEHQRKQLSTLLPTNLAAMIATTPIPEPPIRELKLVVYTVAIPFVGFGIMDNSILIIAGDAIDTTLGVTLGISTMCAAAIGNIISDVAGIGLGTVVEDFCANYLKLPVPTITTAQRQLRSVRFANQLGCCIGIVVGCIIGMFPLLWIDSNKVQAKKRDARLDLLFKDVITQAGGLVSAARIALYLRVDDTTNPIPCHNGRYLYIKYENEAPTITSTSSTLSNNSTGRVLTNSPATINESSKEKQLQQEQQHQLTSSTTQENAITSTNKTGNSDSTSTVIHEEQLLTRKDRFVPVGRGIVSRALLTGDAWNIVDVQNEPDFVPDLGYVTWDDAMNNSGKLTNTMICIPINDSHGRPIAVLQAVNKVQSTNNTNINQQSSSQEQQNTVMRFTENDVQILKALGSHISVTLERMYERAEDTEHEVRLHDTIRILKEYGLAGIEQQQQQKQQAQQNRLDNTNTAAGSSSNNNNSSYMTRFSKNYSNRPLFPE